MTEKTFVVWTKLPSGGAVTVRADEEKELLDALVLSPEIWEQIHAFEAAAQQRSTTAVATATVQASIPATVQYVTEAPQPTAVAPAANPREVPDFYDGRQIGTYHLDAPTTKVYPDGAQAVLYKGFKKDAKPFTQNRHPGEVPGYVGQKPSWAQMKTWREWIN